MLVRSCTGNPRLAPPRPFLASPPTPHVLFPDVAMAEIYNTDRFAELYYAARNAPMGNVGLAARFLIELFRRNSIAFAFIGGWAIHLRGNTRATEDVDIAVGTNMENLKEILLAEER